MFAVCMLAHKSSWLRVVVARCKIVNETPKFHLLHSYKSNNVVSETTKIGCVSIIFTIASSLFSCSQLKWTQITKTFWIIRLYFTHSWKPVSNRISIARKSRIWWWQLESVRDGVFLQLHTAGLSWAQSRSLWSISNSSQMNSILFYCKVVKA